MEHGGTWRMIVDHLVILNGYGRNMMELHGNMKVEIFRSQPMALDKWNMATQEIETCVLHHY